jgi:hypothetical protein
MSKKNENLFANHFLIIFYVEKKSNLIADYP